MSKAELVQQYKAALLTALERGTLHRGKTTTSTLVKPIVNELVAVEAKLMVGNGNQKARSQKEEALDDALKAVGAWRSKRGVFHISKLHAPTAEDGPPTPPLWMMLPTNLLEVLHARLGGGNGDGHGMTSTGSAAAGLHAASQRNLGMLMLKLNRRQHGMKALRVAATLGDADAVRILAQLDVYGTTTSTRTPSPSSSSTPSTTSPKQTGPVDAPDSYGYVSAQAVEAEVLRGEEAIDWHAHVREFVEQLMGRLGSLLHGSLLTKILKAGGDSEPSDFEGLKLIIRSQSVHKLEEDMEASALSGPPARQVQGSRRAKRVDYAQVQEGEGDSDDDGVGENEGEGQVAGEQAGRGVITNSRTFNIEVGLIAESQRLMMDVNLGLTVQLLYANGQVVQKSKEHEQLIASKSSLEIACG